MNAVTPETCARMLRDARRTVALTGAGISTAAGIPDFRGPQGLYVTRRYDPDTVFDVRMFHHRPEPFFEFTRDFLAVVDSLEPTFTHRFLARLEEQGGLRAVVTQNIDALHQKAGSREVLSVHGDYWTSHCLRCGVELSFDQLRERLAVEEVPRCACGGLIKPDVVFFGEPVRDLERAMEEVAASDLLLVLGSSLTVYPVAWLPEQAGGDVVVVNQGPVGLAPGPDRYFAEAGLDGFFEEVAAVLEGE